VAELVRRAPRQGRAAAGVTHPVVLPVSSLRTSSSEGERRGGGTGEGRRRCGSGVAELPAAEAAEQAGGGAGGGWVAAVAQR
jgi:hypothetical protein